MPSGHGKRNLACSRCERVFFVNNSYRDGIFRCENCPLRCSFCGEDIPRTSATERNRRCDRCSALKSRAARKKPRTQFVYARSLAKQRGFEWLLSEAEYTALRALPCHYCGFPLPETGMGIDRMDTRLGYYSMNCVSCCTDCNLAKNANFAYEEMLILGGTIREIKLRREERGEDAPEPHRSIGAPRKY